MTSQEAILLTTRRGWRRAAISIGAVAGLASCSKYQGDASLSLTIPSSENFAVVSAVLEPNCGTLDCHGSPARNLRVYGKRGLRARGEDVTGAANDTNEADIEATYQSVVSVQPEVLSRVFEERGQDPQRWIVLSKARGLERHVGGIRLPGGSPGDRCLVSWAGGALDAASCNADVFGPVPREGETW